MRRWTPLICAGLPLLLVVFPTMGRPQKQIALNFENDVQPILKAHCLACHSGNEAAAGLDLSTAAGVKRGGNSGVPFLVGKPKESLLIRRLRGMDGLAQMPMGFKPLDESKIASIEAWIQSGAQFSGSKRTHWAYIAPVAPLIPKTKDSKWIRNAVDGFVLAKMKTFGLNPSPEADRYTLLRRVTLDLTGLPPSLDEIQDFVADKRIGAYERVVDRLLESPAYGERQARIWLDLARYADTNGFEADRTRTMWPYRDWVIKAFNSNMPYDRFTIEQLAGDLLPNPTQDQLIATGFHRNTMFNEEGGTDAGEQLYYVLLDRVATTGTVWLGSSIGCARCHNHKYDPFSQRDHYSMFAFFNGTDAKREGDAQFGQSRLIEPTVKFQSPEQKAQLAALRPQLAKVEDDLSRSTPEREAAFQRWLGSVSSTEDGTYLRPSAMKADSGAAFEFKSDDSIYVSGANPAKDSYDLMLELKSGTTALIIEAIPDPSFVNGGFGRSSSGNIVLTKVALSANGKALPIGQFAADFTQNGYDVTVLEQGNDESGWALAPDFKRPHKLIAQLRKPLTREYSLNLKLEFHSPWTQHGLGRFRIRASQSEFPNNEVMPSELKAIGLRSEKSEFELTRLRDYFKLNWIENSELIKARLQTSRELAAIEGQPIALLVMRDKPGLTKLEAPLYQRGEYLNPGDPVSAATPAFLPSMPPGVPRNRLGLAKWIVDRRNPLTARVEVNRMWEQYFGRGIVESLDDFGTQSSPPSNQPLLDWLAVKFMNSGWDMKAMHRLIVTSATYRQSSNATRTLIARDPENILLARGPRFRLEAEMIRDQALAASGLLDRKIGGPSVFPYQPEGIWDSPYSGERWMESKGKDRFRRGLYIFWKRTATYPSFMALDATSRESCTARRIRTNTPLQALALLNDPVYVEAAKSLAESSLKQEGTIHPAGSGMLNYNGAIQQAFLRATARPASRFELARLAQTFEKARARFAGTSPKGPNAPEVDAMVLVCNIILNLDETVTKS